MNYLELMVKGFPLLILMAGAIGITWMMHNQEKVVNWKIPTVSKDPRWKNRNQIIDFIFWAILSLGTIGTTIIGLKT